MGLPFLRVVPEAGYWGVRHLAEAGHNKPVYITENGTFAADEVTNGRIDDTERVMYLRSYIGNMQRAIAEGYPLKGYFLWSLLDNFEWADGYTARFGLYYTDFATQKRLPKLSAAWYKALIAGDAMI
jgi:beta-glucosidase